MVFTFQPFRGFWTKPLRWSWIRESLVKKNHIKANSLCCSLLWVQKKKKNSECSSWNWKFYLMKKCIIPLFIACGLIYLDTLFITRAQSCTVSMVTEGLYSWWCGFNERAGLHLNLVVREAVCGPEESKTALPETPPVGFSRILTQNSSLIFLRLFWNLLFKPITKTL